MAKAREDNVFKIIHRVFSVFNLSGGLSNSDVIQGLMGQETDVELKAHCEQIGNLTKSFKRRSTRWEWAECGDPEEPVRDT